jgi:hypothetical protein
MKMKATQKRILSLLLLVALLATMLPTTAQAEGESSLQDSGEIRSLSIGGEGTGSGEEISMQGYVFNVTGENFGGTLPEAGGGYASTPITVGNPVNASLSTASPKHTDNTYYTLYSFYAKAGEQISISMESSDFAPYVELWNNCNPYTAKVLLKAGTATGTAAAAPTAAGTYYTCTSTGTYYIFAGAYKVGSTGAYTLSLKGTTLAGVTLNFSAVSGASIALESVITDSDGKWSQSGFVSGTTYRITPQLTYTTGTVYGFTPAYIDFVAGQDEIKEINFTCGVPVIKLQAPAAGETLAAGDTWDCDWIYYGSIGDTLKLELYKGTTLLDTKTGIPAGSAGKGSYAYAGPAGLEAGSDYKLLISSETDNTIYSETTFSVSTSDLTLTSPDGGQVWCMGQTNDITWSYAGKPSASLKIELIKGDPANPTSSSILADAQSINTKLFSWTIPSTGITAGTDYRIRITRNDTGATSISSNNISIAEPTFQAGGSVLETSSSGVTSPMQGVTLKVERLQGDDTVPAIANTDSSGLWSATFPAATTYRLTPEKTGYYFSPAYIDIDFDTASTEIIFTGCTSGITSVSAPTSSTTWTMGAAQEISWPFAGNIGDNVMISLLKDDIVVEGISIPEASAGTLGLGSCQWTPPYSLTPGDNYSIKLESIDLPGISACSQRFTIGGATASGKITLPSELIGTEITLKVENEKLGTFYITTDTDDNWKIENLNGSSYRVTPSHSTYAFSPAYLDVSVAGSAYNFSYVEKPITITSRGEYIEYSMYTSPYWTQFLTRTIRWDYTEGAGETVKIELLSGDEVVHTVADSVPIGSDGKGTYEWTMSGNIDVGTYKLKITPLEYSTYSDVSEEFYMENAWTLRAPTATDNWVIGTTREIKWAYGPYDIYSSNMLRRNRDPAIPGSAKLELLKGGSSLAEPIVAEVPEAVGLYGQGSYRWTLPTTLEPGNDYQIRISSVEYPNLSFIGNTFSISDGPYSASGSVELEYKGPVSSLESKPVQGGTGPVGVPIAVGQTITGQLDNTDYYADYSSSSSSSKEHYQHLLDEYYLVINKNERIYVELDSNTYSKSNELCARLYKLDSFYTGDINYLNLNNGLNQSAKGFQDYNPGIYCLKVYTIKTALFENDAYSIDYTVKVKAVIPDANYRTSLYLILQSSV